MQDQWLVHPAFTTNAANGGGWDNELTGLWIGKFEATGSCIKDSNGNITGGTLSVKPGVSALSNMTINQQYKFALSGKFGETAILNSHMIKNSEWGAMVYLTFSKYGRNGVDVSIDDSLSTGGTSIVANIYSINYGQSTTNNAYGIYGLKGGKIDNVAAYVNYGGSELEENGGTSVGDLYGADNVEQSTSTRYKNVYSASGGSALASYNLLEATNVYRGDAVWETTTSYTGETSWNSESGNTVLSEFPYHAIFPFFIRGANYNNTTDSGLFYLASGNGCGNDYYSFRVVLAL